MAPPLAVPVALHYRTTATTASHKQFQLPLHIRNTQLTLFNKGPGSTIPHTTPYNGSTITIIIMHSSLYDGPTYKLGLDNSVNHKEIASPSGVSIKLRLTMCFCWPSQWYW